MTPEQKAEARRMRREGFAWDQIAKRIDVTPYMLRCEVQKGFREHRTAAARRQWAGREPSNPARPGGGRLRRMRSQALTIPERPRMRENCDHRVVTAYEYIPDHVLREREKHEAALKRRTLTQILLGDPPEGWSALDQRRQG